MVESLPPLNYIDDDLPPPIIDGIEQQVRCAEVQTSSSRSEHPLQIRAIVLCVLLCPCAKAHEARPCPFTASPKRSMTRRFRF
eukprot:scaffold7381_cov310-Pinguiococcus_pyrenoidosus.AAC.98